MSNVHTTTCRRKHITATPHAEIIEKSFNVTHNREFIIIITQTRLQHLLDSCSYAEIIDVIYESESINRTDEEIFFEILI